MNNPIPEYIIEQAFYRSGGRCECNNASHGHDGKCSALILKAMRGITGTGGWDARLVDPDGPAAPENLLILCSNCCKAAD
ncbi:MAG: hypothetical protein ACOY31_06395 [Bacillota bacterium]